MTNLKFMNKGMLVFSSALILSACGNGGAAENGTVEGEGEVDPDQEATVEIWTTPQFQGVYSPSEDGADYDSFLLEAAQQYMDENPNVTIDVQVISASDRDAELSVALQTDTLPDVFMDSHFVLDQWAHEGVLAPLDDIIDDETREDIPEALWDNVQIGDETYMYPFNQNLGTLVYNADLFREAGLDEYIADEHEYADWTIEEFEEILATLASETSVEPMGLFALNNQGDTWNLNWLRMYGNEFWGEDGHVIANEDSGVQALEKLNEWYENGYTNSGPESVSSNDINAMFQNQQLGVSFTNTILYNTMVGEMERGSLEEFDARLALNPNATDDQIAFTYILSSIVFNTGEDADTAAAKDFVRFYSSDEELKMASSQGVPVRNSVVDRMSTDDNPFLEANSRISEEVYNFSNNTPGYAELRNILYPELQAVFTGQKSAQEALDSYADQANTIIERSTERSAILGN